MGKVGAFCIAWKSQQSHPSPTMKNAQMCVCGGGWIYSISSVNCR